MIWEGYNRQTLLHCTNNFIVFQNFWEKDHSLIWLNFANMFREVLWKESPHQRNNDNNDDDDNNNIQHLQRSPTTLQILYIHVDCFCVLTFSVPCCSVRYDFRIKTMFDSSLPPVVCRMAHVLFTFFVFVYA